MNRRHFIKSSALASACFFLPKLSFGAGKDSFSVFTDDVYFGNTKSGQIVKVFDALDQLLGQGVSIDGLADFTITGVIEDIPKIKYNVQKIPNSKCLSFGLETNKRANIKIYNEIGQEIDNFSSFSSSIDLSKYHNKRLLLYIDTERYSAKGTIINDGKNIHISSKGFYIQQKNIKLPFGQIYKPTTESFRVEITHPNQYNRIITDIPADQSEVADKVVDHFQFGGYSLDESISLFRDFVLETNTRRNYRFSGLKSGFRSNERKYIISNLGFNGEIATEDDMNYIVGVIDEINATHRKLGAREIPWEKRYYNNPDEIIHNVDNELKIVPEGNYGYGYGMFNDNHDGIVVSGVAYIAQFNYNDNQRTAIMEELASLDFGYSGVNNPLLAGKTVLNIGKTIKLPDEVLISILNDEHFKLGTPLEHFLG